MHLRSTQQSIVMTHPFFWAATGGSSLTPCLPLSVLPSVINPVLFQITCQRGRPPQPTPRWTQQSSGFVQQQQVASKSGLCHLSEPCAVDVWMKSQCPRQGLGGVLWDGCTGGKHISASGSVEKYLQQMSQ